MKGKEYNGTGICGYCYPRGDRRKKKVFQCKYCEDYLCEEHLSPKPPTMPVFKSSGPIADRLMREYHEPGHPCFPYAKVAEAKLRKESEEYARALKEALNKKQHYDFRHYRSYNPYGSHNPVLSHKKPEIIKNENYIEENVPLPRSYPEEKHKPSNKSNGYGAIIIFILVAMLIMGIPFFYYSLRDDSRIEENDVYMNLSNFAFKSINDFRLENNLSNLIRSDSAYDFAYFLAKEKAEGREYISDASRSSLAITYDLSSQTYSIVGASGEELSSSGIRLIINGWESFEEIKEKLLNSSYSQGAIGCYDKSCYLVLTKTVSENVNVPLFEKIFKWFASIFGSVSNATSNGINSISQMWHPAHTTPIRKSYVVYSEGVNKIEVTLHQEVYDYFVNSASHEYTYSGSLPVGWEKDYWRMFMTNDEDEYVMQDIVKQVVAATGSAGDKAARAIAAFVQEIPYNYAALNSNSQYVQYPYETLYLDTGVCSEKALLMAKLLMDLGYGVALFSYETENHMAVGIKCPYDQSNYGTGYCFIEPSDVYPIGQIPPLYVGNVRLTSIPELVFSTEGKAYT